MKPHRNDQPRATHQRDQQSAALRRREYNGVIADCFRRLAAYSKICLRLHCKEYRAKAVEYFRRAYHEKPRQITTLYYLARLFHRDGQDDKARKLLSARDTLYFSAVCPVTREMMEALAKEVG